MVHPGPSSFKPRCTFLSRAAHAERGGARGRWLEWAARSRYGLSMGRHPFPAIFARLSIAFVGAFGLVACNSLLGDFDVTGDANDASIADATHDTSSPDGGGLPDATPPAD